MKKNKWLKPLIVIVVIAAILIGAYAGLMSYLSSRSVSVSMSDIISTITSLQEYLIALGVVLVIAIVVAIVAFKFGQPLARLVRGEALVAAVLAVLIVVNAICLGPEYSILNNLLAEQYYVSDETLADAEQLVEDISDEGIMLLKNEGQRPASDGRHQAERVRLVLHQPDLRRHRLRLCGYGDVYHPAARFGGRRL